MASTRLVLPPATGSSVIVVSNKGIRCPGPAELQCHTEGLVLLSEIGRQPPKRACSGCRDESGQPTNETDVPNGSAVDSLQVGRGADRSYAVTHRPKHLGGHAGCLLGRPALMEALE